MEGLERIIEMLTDEIKRLRSRVEELEKQNDYYKQQTIQIGKTQIEQRNMLSKSLSPQNRDELWNACKKIQETLMVQLALMMSTIDGNVKEPGPKGSLRDVARQFGDVAILALRNLELQLERTNGVL